MARSRASWLSRAEPVSTPSDPRWTSASFTPSSVSRSSRIWFEWLMPRDFSTYSPRLRSPLLSRLRSEIQASISEETPRWVSFSSSPLAVRLLNIAVTPRDFRKSTSRSSVTITSVVEPTVARFDRGSTITTLGANSCT